MAYALEDRASPTSGSGSSHGAGWGAGRLSPTPSNLRPPDGTSTSTDLQQQQQSSSRSLLLAAASTRASKRSLLGGADGQQVIPTAAGLSRRSLLAPASPGVSKRSLLGGPSHASLLSPGGGSSKRGSPAEQRLAALRGTSHTSPGMFNSFKNLLSSLDATMEETHAIPRTKLMMQPKKPQRRVLSKKVSVAIREPTPPNSPPKSRTPKLSFLPKKIRNFSLAVTHKSLAALVHSVDQDGGSNDEYRGSSDGANASCERSSKILQIPDPSVEATAKFKRQQRKAAALAVRQRSIKEHQLKLQLIEQFNRDHVPKQQQPLWAQKLHTGVVVIQRLWRRYNSKKKHELMRQMVHRQDSQALMANKEDWDGYMVHYDPWAKLVEQEDVGVLSASSEEDSSGSDYSEGDEDDESSGSEGSDEEIDGEEGEEAAAARKARRRKHRAKEKRRQQRQARAQARALVDGKFRQLRPPAVAVPISGHSTMGVSSPARMGSQPLDSPQGWQRTPMPKTPVSVHVRDRVPLTARTHTRAQIDDRQTWGGSAMVKLDKLQLPLAVGIATSDLTQGIMGVGSPAAKLPPVMSVLTPSFGAGIGSSSPGGFRDGATSALRIGAKAPKDSRVRTAAEKHINFSVNRFHTVHDQHSLPSVLVASALQSGSIEAQTIQRRSKTAGPPKVSLGRGASMDGMGHVVGSGLQHSDDSRVLPFAESPVDSLASNGVRYELEEPSLNILHCYSDNAALRYTGLEHQKVPTAREGRSPWAGPNAATVLTDVPDWLNNSRHELNIMAEGAGITSLLGQEASSSSMHSTQSEPPAPTRHSFKRTGLQQLIITPAHTWDPMPPTAKSSEGLPGDEWSTTESLTVNDLLDHKRAMGDPVCHSSNVRGATGRRRTVRHVASDGELLKLPAIRPAKGPEAGGKKHRASIANGSIPSGQGLLGDTEQPRSKDGMGKPRGTRAKTVYHSTTHAFRNLDQDGIPPPARPKILPLLLGGCPANTPRAVADIILPQVGLVGSKQ